ncbi:hypothetical protein RAD16_06595 [Bradyrhizobium sp. 18BD]
MVVLRCSRFNATSPTIERIYEAVEHGIERLSDETARRVHNETIFLGPRNRPETAEGKQASHEMQTLSEQGKLDLANLTDDAFSRMIETWSVHKPRAISRC